MVRWPPCAARCAGVLPRKSSALASAPCLIGNAHKCQPAPDSAPLQCRQLPVLWALVRQAGHIGRLVKAQEGVLPDEALHNFSMPSLGCLNEKGAMVNTMYDRNYNFLDAQGTRTILPDAEGCIQWLHTCQLICFHAPPATLGPFWRRQARPKQEV